MFNNLHYDTSLGQNDQKHKQEIDGEMELLNLDHINRLEVPITLIPNQSTIDDIKIHMHHRQRLTMKRVNRIMTHLENQIKKYQIDPTNPDYKTWIHYMDYLETIEKTPPTMLKFIWNYWRKILTSYGIPNGKGTTWNYKPPSIPPSQPRTIPSPEQVHELLHFDFNVDSKRKALCQYSLAHSFLFGWRNPSETCMLKIGDIDFDENKITVTEKKKHNKKRIVITEYPQIIHSPRCKSLKNWIDIWRPKLTTQYSRDYLYIRATDGKPLNEMQYTNFITRMVKPHFPWFTMYCTRHFHATGLLIKEYINTGHWNKTKVKNRLGHEREDTTDAYTKYAEEYLNKYRFDWFKRVLKNHHKNKIKNLKIKKMVEENTLKSRNRQKTFVSNGNPTYRSESSEQKQTLYK